MRFVISEIELRKVAMQMLLRAVLIDAPHASLEDRKAAFNRVRVDGAADVFASAVIDRIVARERARA